VRQVDDAADGRRLEEITAGEITIETELSTTCAEGPGHRDVFQN